MLIDTKNLRDKLKGQRLELVLINCSAGDAVVCVGTSDDSDFTEGSSYYIHSNVYGKKYILDDKNDKNDKNMGTLYSLFIKKDNCTQQNHRWLLQDILTACNEGDEVECVRSTIFDFEIGNYYCVKIDDRGEKYILDEGNNQRYKTSHTLFIKKDVQTNCTQTKDEQDSWGIGKSYSAPKKEWQPDVMDVDLTKKIREW